MARPTPAPTPRKTTAAKAADQARAAQEAASRTAWAKRHPDKARAERAIRKHLAIVEDRYGHKAGGTAATHAAAAIAVREGAIARLWESGAIDDDELDAAEQIRAVYARIAADVTVRAASHETRVDHFRHGDGFWEALGVVRAEMAYTAWRKSLRNDAALVLAIVTEDLGITHAARRQRMSVRRARRVLKEALTDWWWFVGDARRQVDDKDLAIAHLRLR